MRFVYKNAQGVVSEFDLGNRWQERGKYITGFDIESGHIKDFLKFRVIEFINNSEKMLSDPYPPAPEFSKNDKNRKYDAAKNSSPEIVFTGFPSVQKKHLQNIASESGFKVVEGITKNLIYICGGANAGPTKLLHARMQGCYILNEAGFFNLINTGELPDYDMLSHIV